MRFSLEEKSKSKVSLSHISVRRGSLEKQQNIEKWKERWNKFAFANDLLQLWRIFDKCKGYIFVTFRNNIFLLLCVVSEKQIGESELFFCEQKAWFNFNHWCNENKTREENVSFKIVSF